MRRRHVTGLAPGAALMGPWAALGGPGHAVTGLVLAGAALVLYPAGVLLSPGFPACLAPRRRRAAWRHRLKRRTVWQWAARAPRRKMTRDEQDSGRVPDWLKRVVKIADLYRCAARRVDGHVCAGPPHVDEIIPWTWGGSHLITNLVVLCETANLTKSGYYVDADGFEHYRPWPGYNDKVMAREILAAGRRARRNPARYLRAVLALR